MQLLDRVEQDVLGIRQQNETASGFNIREWVEEVMTRFQEVLTGEVDIQGVPSAGHSS